MEPAIKDQYIRYKKPADYKPPEPPRHENLEQIQNAHGATCQAYYD